MSTATGTQALKAVATEGKSLTPIKQMELKIGAIQKQLAQAIPQTMQKYLTPERLTRLFWQEARKNPTLLKCTPESVASSLMTAAQLGIEIGVQGQGWLVPYYNSKEKRHDAQFIIGYKGLIALARRSGEVLSVETHIVYEKDKFTLKLGINTVVEHEPYLEGDRGAPRLCYGVARFRDGGYHFEYMSENEIQAIKRRSKAKDYGPWVTDEDQMRRKTVIRRMSNYLPMSIEFANALTVEDAVNEGNRAVIAGQYVEIDEHAPSEAGEPGKQPEGKDGESLLDMVKRICADAQGIADRDTALIRLDDARVLIPEMAPENADAADKIIKAAEDAIRAK